MTAATVEVTVFAKLGGPLTKEISLGLNGTIKSDGSACVMSRGVARRVRFSLMQELADLIGEMDNDEALALGALRDDLAAKVDVVAKAKLNGAGGAGIITRSQEYIVYRPGEEAVVLLDFDAKGMPTRIETKLAVAGGFWRALIKIIPELERGGRVERASTSAGLFNSSNGATFPASGGSHVYLLVKDGTDNTRFLKTLHERCWLAGFGWMMIGAGGQLLERSIVDRVCGTPERLVFEGCAVLIDPVAQDSRARAPLVVEGAALDTVAACPPLTIVELAKLRELRAKESYRLAGEVATARESFITRQARRLIERNGGDVDKARRTIERQCEGVLLSNVELPFDDPELAGKTVAAVLAAPADFEGETLADPLEGIEYGRGKARIMRRADGSVWINSFAHGRTVYELKRDYHSVKAALEDGSERVADTFVRLVLGADLEEDEVEELRNIAAKKSGLGKRTLERKLNAARKQAAARQAQLDMQRRITERRDPRPQIPAPPPDAPWLPQMDVMESVLGASRELEPPMRDIDGVVVRVRLRREPKTRAFTALGANQEETEETRLPAPELPLLTRLNDIKLGELIERYIDYVDASGRSVHLNSAFVRHFQVRDDKLPLAVAIATLPVVLANGSLLASPGLDRDRGIIFRVPSELLKLLPGKKEDCKDKAPIVRAMRFLCDEWLCDVATDYAGKCILIAAALTIIERSLLPDRPTFWITAGRRGGGKTTTLVMLVKAVTGISPAAAAWSPSDEERRKALLSYLLEALPCIIWDNISRGLQISCPHIEKSCTAEFYSDRKLGVSEVIATSAATIHFFTGNNIGPRGDLASRALQTRIEVDRPDPENREFRHGDPIGWTEANRGKILQALYTILLGNPLFHGQSRPAETRFKTWWMLIGQSIEHAAAMHAQDYTDQVRAYLADADGVCPPQKVKFKELFLEQEQEDEDSASLADALAVLVNQYKNDDRKNKTALFRATDVAQTINRALDGCVSEAAKEQADILRDFLLPNTPPNQAVSPTAVGRRLIRRVGEPVAHASQTLTLKHETDPHTKNHKFYVEVKQT